MDLAWDSLPGTVKTARFGDLQRNGKQGGEAIGCEQIALGTVGKDCALAEQDDAVDFGDDFFQMVRDEQEADSARGESAHMVAHFALGGEVEAGGGLVKEQGFGMMDEGAGDEKTARFAGGQFVEPTVCQMRDFEARHGIGSSFFHLGQEVMVRPNADGSEETR